MREEPLFGYAHGVADGSGIVDLGDGVFAPTDEFETVRLPDELGGEWVAVITSYLRTLPDGRVGIHYILGHPSIDAIALNGEILWVRKANPEGVEEE